MRATARFPCKSASQWAIQDSNLGPLPYQASSEPLAVVSVAPSGRKRLETGLAAGWQDDLVQPGATGRWPRDGPIAVLSVAGAYRPDRRHQRDDTVKPGRPGDCADDPARA